MLSLPVSAVPPRRRDERSIPAGANAAQQRRIDDQPAERVNQGHVERRQAAAPAPGPCEIQAVGGFGFDQGAQGTAVDGAVGDLEQLLVCEAIYGPEEF